MLLDTFKPTFLIQIEGEILIDTSAASPMMMRIREINEKAVGEGRAV